MNALNLKKQLKHPESKPGSAITLPVHTGEVWLGMPFLGRVKSGADDDRGFVTPGGTSADNCRGLRDGLPVLAVWRE